MIIYTTKVTYSKCVIYSYLVIKKTAKHYICKSENKKYKHNRIYIKIKEAYENFTQALDKYREEIEDMVNNMEWTIKEWTHRIDNPIEIKKD